MNLREIKTCPASRVFGAVLCRCCLFISGASDKHALIPALVMHALG